MNLDLVVQKLSPLKPGTLKFLAGAAEFDPERMTAPVYPAIYVLPSAEVGVPNDTQGGAQQILVQFALAIAVQGAKDSTGAAIQDVLKPIRQAACAALFGWKPDRGMSRVTYTRGQVMVFKPGGLLWWLDEYSTSYYIAM